MSNMATIFCKHTVLTNLGEGGRTAHIMERQTMENVQKKKSSTGDKHKRVLFSECVFKYYCYQKMKQKVQQLFPNLFVQKVIRFFCLYFVHLLKLTQNRAFFLCRFCQKQETARTSPVFFGKRISA
jgi:hypothetical protein